MGLIKWLKGKFNKAKVEDFEAEYIEDGEIREIEQPIKRSSLNIRDDAQRMRYIKNCCEQMQEAGDEIDKASMEYRLVTDYLKDIEIIEALPADVRGRINKCADRIVKIERDSVANRENLGKIPEEEYQTILRYESEIKEDIEKIVKNEDYKELVRSDMQKLDSEKAINVYHRNELISSMKGLKNLFLITVTASFAAAVILAVLYAAAKLDVTVGFILLAAIIAITFTLEYMSYSKASIKLKRVESYINLVISSQNTVKIRYVNISNLLEYEYRKYKTNSSEELKESYEGFLEEKRARDFLQRANSESALEKQRLIKLMQDIHLRDCSIWTKQCEALINPKEMVEVRHDLNQRRQSLRKRIEYNTVNRDNSKDEINDIAKKYPEYGQEILDIVSSYLVS
ncbi:MAG: hypothetical protein K6G84_08825 [Lachnospiraceae bacterium]|nr:hypothetical protein [Lachnospiraceae bacterium]